MIFFEEGITYRAELLNIDLVKITVTGCWYKQAHVHVAISRSFVSLHLLGGGGGPKSILFSLFQNKKASFKGIYMLNVRSFFIQKV